MKKVLTPLAKTIFILLGWTAAASGTDSAIEKKLFGPSMFHWDLTQQTTLIISNEEMKYIKEIVMYLGESNLMNKGGSNKIESESKEKRCISWHAVRCIRC